MNIGQLNQFAISDFLEKAGISPAYQRGRNWWYFSPIRIKERTPSFKVNIQLNLWYDHGTGEGGKLFDLAMRLYNTGDIKDTIQRLQELFCLERQNQPLKPFGSNLTKANNPGKPDDTEFPIVIRFTKPLGNNAAISEYLLSRGISFSCAKPYCREVYYRINDRNYFALGFQNRSGGYELRNPFFKGSSTPKDITIIRNPSDSICVLEGSCRSGKVFPSTGPILP